MYNLIYLFTWHTDGRALLHNARLHHHTHHDGVAGVEHELWQHLNGRKLNKQQKSWTTKQYWKIIQCVFFYWMTLVNHLMYNKGIWWCSIKNYKKKVVYDFFVTDFQKPPPFSVRLKIFKFCDLITKHPVVRFPKKIFSRLAVSFFLLLLSDRLHNLLPPSWLFIQNRVYA